MVEVKALAGDAWFTAESGEWADYWERYRFVLVTNYRSFLMVSEDRDGRSTRLLPTRGGLQEIDLEDGAISWLPGVSIDKSRAIGVCEELNDQDKRAFHWHVFQNKPLMAFLCQGSHEHFLVDEEV